MSKNVALTEETHKRLTCLTNKGETYSSAVERIIDFYDGYHVEGAHE